MEILKSAVEVSGVQPGLEGRIKSCSLIELKSQDHSREEPTMNLAHISHMRH